MANRKRQKQRETLASKYRKLDDAAITERWKAFTPKVARYLGIFAALVIGLFVFNRFGHPSQTVTNIINVAFQVSVAFCACLLMLLVSALYFSRSGPGKRT